MTEIVQITDTHLFAAPGGRLKGVDVDAGLRAVIDGIRRHHPRAERVLLTGDLVHEETAASYRRLTQALAGLGLPVYCLPGNHEDKELLRQACDGRPLCWEREVRLGHWRILLLDSARPPEPAGYLGADELAFVESALAEAPGSPTLIALHHPPLSVNSPWLDPMAVADGDRLLELVARHPQVRGVVFGHIHQQFETSRGGVRLLGTPSTCAQFRPGVAVSTADARPPGYRWLRLGDDGRLATGVVRVAWPPSAGVDSTAVGGSG